MDVKMLMGKFCCQALALALALAHYETAFVFSGFFMLLLLYVHKAKVRNRSLIDFLTPSYNDENNATSKSSVS